MVKVNINLVIEDVGRIVNRNFPNIAIIISNNKLLMLNHAGNIITKNLLYRSMLFARSKINLVALEI